ncbi:MAG TPA: hypothetical protein VFE32_05315 [Puia sp.]|jgi:hypothetical protein|nr:hypothetical protein [Puia sp.]
MKNSLPILTVAILSLFLAPSCSKKSSNPAQTCRIVTISDQIGTSTTVYNISYNNSGKISTEQYSQNSTNYSRVFTYIGNTEIMTTSDGTTTITDSITLNGNGMIESDYATDGTNTDVTTYTYSGTELQKSVEVLDGGTPTTSTYTWTNGDLTGASLSGSQSGTYSYNSKASEAGDYWQIVQLVNYGAVFVRTTHQLSGYQAGTTVENVNYTYDNTGKITAVAATTGANVENISYQYNCN